jgi:hypothetical protein
MVETLVWSGDRVKPGEWFVKGNVEEKDVSPGFPYKCLGDMNFSLDKNILFMIE